MTKSEDSKFDQILKRMTELKPLTKAEISARIHAERDARKAKAFERYKQLRESGKLGKKSR